MITAATEFHPEFYATVATVLPVFLLVTNLVAFYVQRAEAPRPQIPPWFHRYSTMFAVLANVAAEAACLAVLFVRSANTVVNVIIWIGVSESMLWVGGVLLLYVVVMSKPQSRDHPEIPALDRDS